MISKLRIIWKQTVAAEVSRIVEAMGGCVMKEDLQDAAAATTTKAITTATTTTTTTITAKKTIDADVFEWHE